MSVALAAVGGKKSKSPVPAEGWRSHLVTVAGMLGLAFLLAPLLVVIAFSFNKPRGRFNLTWVQFSTDAWTNPCRPTGLCDALLISLKIGLLATVVAVVLGTLAALALARSHFRGRSAMNLLVFLPMATPEVVAGSSLLTLFINLGLPLGQVTIFIAHVAFCVSFVVVTVKSRLAGLDPRLEEAAADLYASKWQTFRYVTLPLAVPGIASAALLSFALSFDDFIITNFTSGQTVTFPMYVWGAQQRAIPPQLNVVGAAMLFISLLIVGAIAGVRHWRRRRPSVTPG